jgi:hypothetical protein
VSNVGRHVTKAAVLDAAHLLYCSFSYGYMLTVQTWIISSIAEEMTSCVMRLGLVQRTSAELMR